MSEDLESESPETSSISYSRWKRLAATSPSGKTLFVCMICGHVTPAPGACPAPNGRWDLPDLVRGYVAVSQLQGTSAVAPDGQLRMATPPVSAMTCAMVEQAIIEQLRAGSGPRLQELRFKHLERVVRQQPSTCLECHDYGCALCLGSR
jgi:hypothetical protein